MNKRETLKARLKFVRKYCIERNWNPEDLSLEQLLEIRRQPEWRLFCDSAVKQGAEYV